VGALFDSDAAFGGALAHALSCKPSDCRDWAVSRFSSRVCAESYLALYERVVQGENVFGLTTQ
jgi:hypothetical protein